MENDSNGSDFYRLLGVPVDAAQEEVHAAYRREAKAWHPDRNPVDGAAERFKLIGTAYHTLADPDRRRAYDNTLIPRLVFVPDVVDFGHVRPGDDPREVTVALRNLGYPYDPGTVVDFEDPADGPFWEVFGVGYDEAAEDSRTLCLYSFETDLDPGVPVAPGRHEKRASVRLVCASGTYTAELTVRVVVMADPTTHQPDTVVDRRPAYVPAPEPAFTAVPSRIRAYGCGALALALTVLAVIVVLAATRGSTSAPAAAADPVLTPAPMPARTSLTLPAKIPAANYLLLDDGQLVNPDNNGSITLLNGNGKIRWNRQSIVNYARAAVSPNCAVIVDKGGTGDMVTLDSGAQTPVPTPIGPDPSRVFATPHPVAPAMSGDDVAWGDGTIRNACTGVVVDRAAPGSPAIGLPECLIGSTVIATNGEQQTAWAHGTQLWGTSTAPLLCDAQGAVIQLDDVNHVMNMLDPRTGEIVWSAGDPDCVASPDTHCGVADDPSLSLWEAGDVLLLSTSTEVIAIARSNGAVLWKDNLRCVLAAHSAPRAEVLLGACDARDQYPTIVSVAEAGTGHPHRNIDVGSVQPASPGAPRWLANARHLAVIDTASGAPVARLVDW